ncbi:5790_t:CDS:1, partial [Ambispora gerdemannii]
LQEVTTDDEEIRHEELVEKQKRIWEVVFYCESMYDCRRISLAAYHAWENDVLPPSCSNCDNCILRIKDNAESYNVKDSAIKMLEIAKELVKFRNVMISRKDIIEIFSQSKSANIRFKELDIYKEQRKKLLTIDEAKHLFDDLVIRNLILVNIQMKRQTPTCNHLTFSFPVIGVVEGANARAEMENWLYLIKKRRGS